MRQGDRSLPSFRISHIALLLVVLSSQLLPLLHNLKQFCVYIFIDQRRKSLRIGLAVNVRGAVQPQIRQNVLLVLARKTTSMPILLLFLIIKKLGVDVIGYLCGALGI
ncbi:uncharacterized protein LOC133778137 isoform X1 [Humulus lupulus]|uniref:uncharacterized protein LOC133778137 isoform X1 n=1 Tax=Humulus lupulus TaxID=3486 RepID=UPI002B410BA4|nr:uncharacterized protein LOC133778137 isoform X1 [Humulus lupulus]